MTIKNRRLKGKIVQKTSEKCRLVFMMPLTFPLCYHFTPTRQKGTALSRPLFCIRARADSIDCVKQLVEPDMCIGHGRCRIRDRPALVMTPGCTSASAKRVKNV